MGLLNNFYLDKLLLSCLIILCTQLPHIMLNHIKKLIYIMYIIYRAYTFLGNILFNNLNISKTTDLKRITISLICKFQRKFQSKIRLYV